MKHFYFKYGIGNSGFEKRFLENEDSFELSIYFGKWKVSDYPNNIGKQNAQSIKQINTFMELPENEESFFWIFQKEKVYCFKSINVSVFDGSLNDSLFGDEIPKSIKVKLVKEFKKIELPDFFANINSNQRYNRKTIEKITGSELKYADSLINNEPLVVNSGNFFEYLSPIQFETLIFMIFNDVNNGLFCSAFRGGTLKDFDFRVFLESDFKDIPKGEHWLQVKYKRDKIVFKKGYLVYLGENNLDNNTIGIEWIKERIEEREDILKWHDRIIVNPILNLPKNRINENKINMGEELV